MKMPSSGGSYTRNSDGSLTRKPHPKAVSGAGAGAAKAEPKKPGASKGRKKPATGGK